MSLLHDACQELLRELEKIIPDLPAQVTFGDADVSTPDIRVRVGDVSLAASSSSQVPSSSLVIDAGDYSFNAVLAVARIANIVDAAVSTRFAAISAASLGKSIDDNTGNGQVLNRCFNYLDMEWVPKVIDERSYKVALALQTFLATLLNPANNVLDFSVAGSSALLQEKARAGLESLAPMKERLDARILAYEVNIKDFDQKVSFVALRKKSERILDTFVETSFRLRAEIKVNEVTGTDDADRIEQMERNLREIQQSLTPETGSRFLEIQQQIYDFQRDMTAVRQEARSPTFPDKIQTNIPFSRLADAIIRNDPDHIEEERKKYETLITDGLMTQARLDRILPAMQADAYFRPADIARAGNLLRQHKPQELTISISTPDSDKETIRSQRAIYEEALKDSLPHYLDKCRAAKGVIQIYHECLPSTDAYPLVSNDQGLVHEQSTAATAEERITDNIVTLNILHERLENFQTQLAFQKAGFERTVQVPDESDPLFTVIAGQKNKYLAKFDEHLSGVNAAMATVDAELNAHRRELARYDSGARAERLASLVEATRTARFFHNSAEHMLAEKESVFRQLTDSNAHDLSSIQSEMTSLGSAIESINRDKNERVSKLHQLAQDKLEPLLAKAAMQALRGAQSFAMALTNHTIEDWAKYFDMKPGSAEFSELERDYKFIANPDNGTSSTLYNILFALKAKLQKMEETWNLKALNRLEQLEHWLRASDSNEEEYKTPLPQIEADLERHTGRLAGLQEQKAAIEARIMRARQDLEATRIDVDLAELNHDISEYALALATVENQALLADQAIKELDSLISEGPGDDVWEHVVACENGLKICDVIAETKILQDSLAGTRASIQAKLDQLPHQAGARKDALIARLVDMDASQVPLLDLYDDKKVIMHITTLISQAYAGASGQRLDELNAHYDEFIEQVSASRREGFDALRQEFDDECHELRRDDLPISLPSEGSQLSVSAGSLEEIPDTGKLLGKRLDEYYVYAGSQRHHRYNASTQASFFKGENRTFQYLDKPEDRDLTGDELKTKILELFKATIENCKTSDELREWARSMRRTSTEYKIISTSQDIFTKIIGKTDSLKAFNEMVSDKHRQLEEDDQLINNGSRRLG